MGKHILVVDDDPAIRSLLQDLLEEEAYQVEIASNGLLAWDKLTTTPGNYKVIVLDLQMPQMDGLQLIQRLQDWRGTFLRSIFVLSSDNDAIQQALSMGIRHALVKPFDLEVFLAQISCLLGGQESGAAVS